MKREPQTNSTKDRLVAWLKKVGKRLLAFLQDAWQRFKKKLKQVWHRYQLTRWLIVVFLSLFLLMSIHLTFVAKTSDVKNLQNRLSRPTMIYDNKKQSAGSLYSQKGTYVKLNNISSSVPDAVLSTEDRNFYHEHGFSVKGLGRAAFLLVKNKVLHRDYISGGGSTLTQQLVKNAFLTQQQTFSRKAREIFIAIEVENQYSKNEILTMYLNNAYFGHGVWGVQDAARRYFDVNASQLTVPQAATLAGMLTSPGIYDPIDHPEATRERRNMVLQLMVENKKLSQSDANAYKKTSLGINSGYVANDSYKYPYFFDAVISEAASRYNISEKSIMNDGYKIYTTLDQDQQQSMQDTYDNDNNFPDDSADGTMVQSASIAMNPKTGGVTAVVGGRGKHVFRGFNRATQMRRQPGSTIKPIVVYAPALEHGYFYDSELQDKKQSYGTNNYTPKNYDDTYSGKVPMYKALYESLNAPAVWLLNKIGVNQGYKMAEKFGLPVEKGDKNLALALGGMTKGVSPQQIARAYATFDNDGQMPTPYYITKIEDASGKVVAQNKGSKVKHVISSKTAREMTSMLIGVYEHGTGETAKPAGYTLAGKTGTTNSGVKGDESNDRDKWIVGYTPDVVVATWEGYDDTNSSHVLNDISERNINGLFKNEMSGILANTPGTRFTVQDAQIRANKRVKNTSGWKSFFNGGDNALMNRFNQSVNNIGDKASQFWNNVKSLF
ncbi:MAG: PBP1A family penicillin-binding protein [Limosilactobacillus oris]|jgi:penicillin-binding protein 2A|uniref:PBP1A family penicillin-binding protein n=1 Tax=Limosilactobacillus oris TaxID=1632 RepID=UPI001D7A2AAA|nr:PBP1A family penicillin-binding protein [Limosilactobacillus oris]MCH3911394.1 PBP1A family penicillin-binding protein [Limosilactobacillus oris]MCH3938644.1 PBP1A family penicillin-binding protein [Limosilactobacillus oris]MCI1980228.1 PBP1A family penicillin-binding protein [Limosilactobacillus oris]MCI2042986.1 PBP1A family penicillin-binding protein [Limosilactobacillus oris]UXC67948.1 PBP1A family penicillin-binding protein [Limosilactobacillus oris]